MGSLPRLLHNTDCINVEWFSCRRNARYLFKHISSEKSPRFANKSKLKKKMQLYTCISIYLYEHLCSCICADTQICICKVQFTKLCIDVWSFIRSCMWIFRFWDDWMRHPEQRRNRECIRPEVCRTSTFGKKGVSK